MARGVSPSKAWIPDGLMRGQWERRRPLEPLCTKQFYASSVVSWTQKTVRNKMDLFPWRAFVQVETILPRRCSLSVVQRSAELITSAYNRKVSWGVKYIPPPLVWWSVAAWENGTLIQATWVPPWAQSGSWGLDFPSVCGLCTNSKNPEPTQQYHDWLRQLDLPGFKFYLEMYALFIGSS